MCAKLYQRLIAYVIDVSLMYAVSGVLINLATPKVNIDIFVVQFYCSLLYFYISLKFLNGQTVGCHLLKIRVVSQTQNELPHSMILTRAVLMPTFSTPIGMIWLIGVIQLLLSLYILRTEPFKEKNQTSWDVFTRSLVIKLGS